MKRKTVRSGLTNLQGSTKVALEFFGNVEKGADLVG